MFKDMLKFIGFVLGLVVVLQVIIVVCKLAFSFGEIKGGVIITAVLAVVSYVVGRMVWRGTPIPNDYDPNFVSTLSSDWSTQLQAVQAETERLRKR